ncbi:MAG: hypothetical protein IJ583_14445 [Firmicutes bacterium]|nr:hypothetical protein [Bacillota bacterium]
MRDIDEDIKKAKRQLGFIKESLDEIIKSGKKARESISSITDVMPREELETVKNDISGIAGSAMGLIGDMITPLLTPIDEVCQKIRYAIDLADVLVRMIFGESFKINTGSDENSGENIKKNVDTAASAAKKGVEKIKRALAGFDEINILKINESKSESEKNAAESTAAKKPSVKKVNEKALAEAQWLKDKLKEIADMIAKEFERIKKLFEIGFDIGSGGAELSNVFNGVDGIKKSLKNIFLNDDILGQLKELYDNVILSFGKIAGSAAYIAGVIGKTFIDGIDKYLSRNADYIRERIKGILESANGIIYRFGELSAVIADIFSAFDNDIASNIAANIFGIFGNALLGLADLAGKIADDTLKTITNVISENSEGIKLAIVNTLIPIESVTEGIKNTVTASMEKMLECYEIYVRPSFENIENGLSRILAALLNAYNEYIAPVLQRMGEKWKEFFEVYLQPVINNGIVMIGELAETVSMLFERYIAPYAENVINGIAPLLAAAIEEIGNNLLLCAKIAAEAVNAIINSIRGLVGYMKGTFGGDLAGAFKSMADMFKNNCQSFINILNMMIERINGFKVVLPKIGDIGGGTIGFNIPKIPALAGGGIVDSPMISMIGEMGREAVIPLERDNTGIEMIAERLAESIGNMRGGNTEITVKIGEEKIIKKVIEGINRESMMKGRSVII